MLYPSIWWSQFWSKVIKLYPENICVYPLSKALWINSNVSYLPDRNIPELNPWLFYQLITTFEGATFVKDFLRILNVEPATWSPLRRWTILRI